MIYPMKKLTQNRGKNAGLLSETPVLCDTLRGSGPRHADRKGMFVLDKMHQ